MTRRHVGGKHDLAALMKLHQTLGAAHGGRPEGADQHRPQDRRGYQRAVRDLTRQGLQPGDIADLLNLTPGTVRELLAEGPPATFAARHRHRGEP